MTRNWLSWLTLGGRILLAVFFVFAGTTHFLDLKYDYQAMIPSPFPQGMWMVYLTGVLEIAGGVGLLLSQWKRTAGICLILFLIAVFPANVNAALQGIPFGGQPATPLLPRTVMQLVLIALIWATSVRSTKRQ